MANQRSFAELEHDGKKRTTRRERFLAKMDGLMPWDALERRIEPFYPAAGKPPKTGALSALSRKSAVDQTFPRCS